MNERQRDDHHNDATERPAPGFGRKLSRRGVMRGGAAGAAGLALASAAGSAGAAPVRRSSLASSARQAADPVRGGVLRVAATGQPAGLDMHFTNQRTVTMIGWQM